MFTGLITDVGIVAAREGGRFSIATSYRPGDLLVGASVACDGACMTATSVTADGPGAIFTFDASNETLSKTTLGGWKPGRRINLERSLTASAELGGHIVTGHVDGVVTIAEVRTDGESRRLVFEAPEHLAPYIAAKGSVALDGTSLTVNEIADNRFGVNLIPHTLTVTTWGAKSRGDSVNLEVDLIARYVARLLESRR